MLASRKTMNIDTGRRPWRGFIVFDLAVYLLECVEYKQEKAACLLGLPAMIIPPRNWPIGLIDSWLFLTLLCLSLSVGWASNGWKLNCWILECLTRCSLPTLHCFMINNNVSLITIDCNTPINFFEASISAQTNLSSGVQLAQCTSSWKPWLQCNWFHLHFPMNPLSV